MGNKTQGVRRRGMGVSKAKLLLEGKIRRCWESFFLKYFVFTSWLIEAFDSMYAFYVVNVLQEYKYVT